MSSTAASHTIAYSSDSDDALMIAPWQRSLIPAAQITCEFLAEDIEILNLRAREGCYAVSAVSAAVYPFVRQHYRILPMGASFGASYGPALITSVDAPYRHIQDLAGAKLAVPGLHTSAYATAKMLLEPFEAHAVPFDQVAPCVRSGICDAGIVIHELQLSVPQKDFHVIGNLGSLWQRAYHDKALPLGMIVVRRNLNEEHQRCLATAYRRSIAYAWNHRQELISTLTGQLPEGFAADLLPSYLQRYVGEGATALSEHQRLSLDIWFAAGSKKGLWDRVDVQEAVADDLVAGMDLEYTSCGEKEGRVEEENK